MKANFLAIKLAKVVCTNKTERPKALAFLRRFRDKLRWAAASRVASKCAEWTKVAVEKSGAKAHEFLKCDTVYSGEPCSHNNDFKHFR